MQSKRPMANVGVRERWHRPEFSRRTKGGGLTRELSSDSKPTFYPCTVFRQPRPLPEGAIRCRWPAHDCIVYYRTGEVTGGNSIVYVFYALAARWTVHANIDR